MMINNNPETENGKLVFVEPEVEVVRFDYTDVITASGDPPTPGGPGGDEGSV